MISCLDDAIPFFMYWQQERTPLHAMVTADGMTILSVGYIAECSDREFAYVHPEGGYELRISFDAVRRVAFMTPEDFHRGSVRKGDVDVPLRNGWILHTGSGGFMNFFEEDTARSGSAC